MFDVLNKWCNRRNAERSYGKGFWQWCSHWRCFRILLPSSSSTAPTASFLRLQTDKAIDDKKNNHAFASKKPVDIAQTFNDNTKLWPRRFKYRNHKLPCRKLSKHRLKRCYSKSRNWHVNLHLSSSKLSKESYDYCRKSQSKNDEQSKTKRLVQCCWTKESATDGESAVDCHEKS